MQKNTGVGVDSKTCDLRTKSTRTEGEIPHSRTKPLLAQKFP